jgi:hypothetical protein
MEEKSVQQIYSDYLYTELEYVRKRIDELKMNRFTGVLAISKNVEMETLLRKEAFYILQLARLKGIIKSSVN